MTGVQTCALPILKMAGRLKAMGSTKYQSDGDPRTSGPGFRLTIHSDALDLPLRLRKPTTFFVNSMSDLFHPDVPHGFLADAFGLMAVAGELRGHQFQVLTKRPQRMAHFFGPSGYRPRAYKSASNGFPLDYPTIREAIASAAHRWAIDRVNAGALSDAISTGYKWPLPNVWLGTSIESDRYVFRADHLRETPAAVRFLSLEPLLGPLPSLDLTGIDWVIVGGESGPGARPMHPDWVRDIRDRCIAAGIPFFFKQWGAWLGFGRDQYGASFECAASNGVRHYEWNGGDDGQGVFTGAAVRLGKKLAGRELDGRTWDEMPVPALT